MRLPSCGEIQDTEQANHPKRPSAWFGDGSYGISSRDWRSERRGGWTIKHAQERHIVVIDEAVVVEIVSVVSRLLVNR